MNLTLYPTGYLFTVIRAEMEDFTLTDIFKKNQTLWKALVLQILQRAFDELINLTP